MSASLFIDTNIFANKIGHLANTNRTIPEKIHRIFTNGKLSIGITNSN